MSYDDYIKELDKNGIKKFFKKVEKKKSDSIEEEPLVQKKLPK